MGFLGDPDFPQKALKNEGGETTRGLKIDFFQRMYMDYSKLQFSVLEDRPIGIRGLETRLRKAYKCSGVFGVFNDGPNGGLFHRSLLWWRENDELLAPIAFSTNRKMYVPSWSWMAYTGTISFLSLEFGVVHWEGQTVCPPKTEVEHTSPELIAETGEFDISISARDFAAAEERENEFMLKYDTAQTTSSDGLRPQCVVVARRKGSATDDERLNYVIIVGPKSSWGVDGRQIYERLGAGYMLGKYILDGPSVLGRIH